MSMIGSCVPTVRGPRYRLRGSHTREHESCAIEGKRNLAAGKRRIEEFDGLGASGYHHATHHDIGRIDRGLLSVHLGAPAWKIELVRDQEAVSRRGPHRY